MVGFGEGAAAGTLVGSWTTTEVDEDVVLVLVVDTWDSGLWKNCPAETETVLEDELAAEELGAGLSLIVDMNSGVATEDVFAIIGVTKVVGKARLTLAVAPCREVTGTGDGMEGAVEEFMAVSSQAFIQP